MSQNWPTPNMTRNVSSYRLPQHTETQIDALTARMGMSKANVITLAVDRMYREETRMNTQLILQGEFSGEFASADAIAARDAAVVTHLGTVRSTAEVNRLLDTAQHYGAVWSWHDGSHTVVDIRPK